MTRLRSSWASSVSAFVACEVRELVYVLPVEQVQEILQPLPLTPLPHAPAGIIGAVEHREKIVPVLDLGVSLGFGETDSPRRKWVLVNNAGRTVGVVVNRVHEVFEAPISELREAPDVGDSLARAASQVLSYRGKMAFVLSMKSVAILADIVLNEEECE